MVITPQQLANVVEQINNHFAVLESKIERLEAKSVPAKKTVQKKPTKSKED